MGLMDTLRQGMNYFSNVAKAHPTIGGAINAVQESPNTIFGIDRNNLGTPQKQANAIFDMYARMNPITAAPYGIAKGVSQYFTRQPQQPQQQVAQPSQMRQGQPIHNWQDNMPQRQPMNDMPATPIRQATPADYSNMTKWLGY